MMKLRRMKLELKITYVLIIALVSCITIHLANQNEEESLSKENEHSPDVDISLSKFRNFSERDECLKKTVLQNGAFCISKYTLLTYLKFFDPKLCGGIEKLIKRSTIVDLGAGFGFYGRCFLRRELELKIPKEQLDYVNANFESSLRRANLIGTPPVIKHYKGYDGVTDVEIITNNFVKKIHLEKEFDLGRKFDWVLSLEVGEHIPRQYEEIFLNNISKHSCKGIILSWALLGQDDWNHVNNSPNEYVVERLKERGFDHDLEAQKELRKHLEVFSFVSSLMVFRRRKIVC